MYIGRGSGCEKVWVRGWEERGGGEVTEGEHDQNIVRLYAVKSM